MIVGLHFVLLVLRFSRRRLPRLHRLPRGGVYQSVRAPCALPVQPPPRPRSASSGEDAASLRPGGAPSVALPSSFPAPALALGLRGLCCLREVQSWASPHVAVSPRRSPREYSLKDFLQTFSDRSSLPVQTIRAQLSFPGWRLAPGFPKL